MGVYCVYHTHPEHEEEMENAEGGMQKVRQRQRGTVSGLKGDELRGGKKENICF